MASNAVLDRLVEPAMRTARRRSKKSGETEHVYGEFRYKTKKTWKYKRRILYKAEVTRHPNRDPKDNPRFVVTNMKQTSRDADVRIRKSAGDKAVTIWGRTQRRENEEGSLVEARSRDAD